MAATLAEAGVPAIVKRIGVKEVFGESGQAGELLDKYGRRARNIVAAARELLGTRKS